MSILSVEEIYKSYGDKVLFDHISFVISEKQRIGLIGVNGSGKSTLLKIIAGTEPPEEGKIVHASQFRVEYLPQDPELDDERTVLEEVYHGDSDLMIAMRAYEQVLGDLEQQPEDEKTQLKYAQKQQRMDDLGAWEAITTAKTILTRLGVTDFTRRVKELSGGQRKRVAIAKALIQPADLLILDEPTNHLDHEMIEWLEGYLPQYRGALLLVTHDRYFLNRVTNRILELDQGQLYTYEGNYETFLEKKAEREEQQIAGERKRQNLLRRELAWLKRGAKARTTKQKARIDRIERIQGQAVQASGEAIDIALGSSRLGKKVIELQAVTKHFAEKKVIHELDYLVTPGERLGIIGPNGSGKTTLLQIMSGQVSPDTGSIDIGETVKIGYYRQDHSEMNENLRVIEYIKEMAEVVRTAEGTTITAEQMLERFLFSRPMQWTYIRALSGGERRRLYLLRTLMSEPNVLLLDEPTNDLDTQTLSILEEYLDYYPGVVITVSHDRYFLDRVVERLIAFEGHASIRLFEGNYSEYLEQRKVEKQRLEVDEREKREQNVAASHRKEKRRRLTYKEQKEWEEIEDRIARLEQKNEELQQQIEQAGSDSGQVQALYKEQQQVEEALEQAIERWSELSLLVEDLENDMN